MAKNSKAVLRKRKHVALIIESSNEYARKVLYGIRKYMHENRQWMIFYHEHQRGNTDLSWLTNWDGDGILARIENQQIANFVVNKNLPTIDLSSSRLLPFLPYVETNDCQYARAAADHLLARQFKHFAYCGDSQFKWSRLREKYFIQYIEIAIFLHFVLATFEIYVILLLRQKLASQYVNNL